MSLVLFMVQKFRDQAGTDLCKIANVESVNPVGSLEYNVGRFLISV